MFILRARDKHGDQFDYSNSRFAGFAKPIEVVCRRHGACTTTPQSHLANRAGGCRKCREELVHLSRSLSTDKFIRRAKEIHGDRYDYHLVHSAGTRSRVVIVCPRHGSFRMKACRHLEGRGCRKCAFERIGSEQRLSFWDFVERVIEVHGANQYEYELKDFVNLHSSIPIHCPRHGRFLQSVANHLKGRGCPSCIHSLGEKRVHEVLQMLDVEFTEQARFSDCCDRQQLRFDFYVPSRRLLIEFDGRQHYETSEKWGGEEKLADIQRRDAIKDRFAAEHGYRLLRIPYWEYQHIDNLLLDALTTTALNQQGADFYGDHHICA
jgi:very-short-patch-repair endonuclease